MSAAERLSAFLASLPSDVQEKVEAVRQRTGRVSAAGEYDQVDREARSKAAFEEIYALRGLSVWRAYTHDGKYWRVIYMTEESMRTKMDEAALIIEKHGGQPVCIAEAELEALRSRRWEQMAKGLWAWVEEGIGPEEWGNRIYFNEGALLRPDGTLEPL